MHIFIDWLYFYVQLSWFFTCISLLFNSMIYIYMHVKYILVHMQGHEKKCNKCISWSIWHLTKIMIACFMHTSLKWLCKSSLTIINWSYLSSCNTFTKNTWDTYIFAYQLWFIGITHQELRLSWHITYKDDSHISCQYQVIMFCSWRSCISRMKKLPNSVDWVLAIQP